MIVVNALTSITLMSEVVIFMLFITYRHSRCTNRIRRMNQEKKSDKTAS